MWKLILPSVGENVNLQDCFGQVKLNALMNALIYKKIKLKLQLVSLEFDVVLAHNKAGQPYNNGKIYAL